MQRTTPERFYQMWIEKIVIIILHILSILVPLLLSVAFMTLAERKVMASMQRRVGPNVWGFCGVLQPFLDGLKLFVKEPVFPANADQPLFVWAPMFTFIVSQIGWSVIPAEQGVVLSDVNLGAMYLLSVSSLGVYGIMIAGWSSNSKYAFLGCCRSVAQMISYELPMGIILMTVCLIAGSLNISEIIACQKNIWFGMCAIVSTISLYLKKYRKSFPY